MKSEDKKSEDKKSEEKKSEAEGERLLLIFGNNLSNIGGC